MACRVASAVVLLTALAFGPSAHAGWFPKADRTAGASGSILRRGAQVSSFARKGLAAMQRLAQPAAIRPRFAQVVQRTGARVNGLLGRSGAPRPMLSSLLGTSRMSATGTVSATKQILIRRAPMFSFSALRGAGVGGGGPRLFAFNN